MKRIQIPLFTIATTLMLTTGCSSEMPAAVAEELLMIRAYLFAGESVSDIQVTGTLPLGSEETVLPPINDAEVYLVKNSQRYDLVPSAGDSGYYHYDDDDLTVEAGDIFDIHVIHGSRTAWGTTLVPEAPASISASSDSLYIPESFFPGSGIDQSEVTIDWEEVPSALWYVVVENIDVNPEPIERRGFFGGDGPGRFISPPRTMNMYTIRSMLLTHYGTHRVKVYRINQEYADLYSSRQQDTRDLNEPRTNIVNGLGIFSAFSSQEVMFHAARQP